MSMNPQSENIIPPVDSADSSPLPQPSVLDVHATVPIPAAEIKLDDTPEDSSASIIKEAPLFPPILQGNTKPEIDLDNQTAYETVEHHGVQTEDEEYPTSSAVASINPALSEETEEIPKKKTDRIRSVDALRGFDMFWIVGGNILLLELAKLYDWAWLKWATTQLDHPAWQGFTFYDLIFPLFLFLAGVSMPISLGKKLAQGATKASLLGKVTLRAILLILLGIIYNGGLELRGLEETRLFSVLGFIGISYFIAALIYIFSDTKHRVMWTIGLLGGYYAALIFINVPEHGAGVHTPEGIFTGYIDRTWVAWKIYTPNYDPEGLFLPIAGAVIVIVGSLTGSFLVSCSWNKFLKAFLLGVFGAGFWFAAQQLEPHMMIAKNFWSPTFVILCLGWSLILLGAFYLIIDAIGFWQWAFFFIVIGMNSITIYMALRLFNFTETSKFLFGGTINKFFKIEYQPLLTSVAFILTWWMILLFMYRKKIFLRV